MSGSLYLAWRYMRHQRIKTAILIGSITLILYMPAGLQVMVEDTAGELAARAGSTPLLVGRKGSALELTLNSLYFESESPEPTNVAQLLRIRKGGHAEAVPLHVRFRVRRQPIVGTTLDYFEFRGLSIERGRQLAFLGEAVLGADAADALDAGPGGRIVSAPQSLFDLAGVYPLEMKVVGVLARSFSPDDEAVFVDIKTAWVIEGLAHGHEDLAAPAARDKILEVDGNRRVANASVVQYTEITDENRDSFHFHGDLSGFPVTAILALPHDKKSQALLMGDYLADDETCQILEPSTVMEQLLATIAEVRRYVIAAVLVVGTATLVSTVLVFLLSIRLRRREIETMGKIGCSRGTVASLLVGEILIVFFASALLAAALAAATHSFGPALIKEIVF